MLPIPMASVSLDMVACCGSNSRNSNIIIHVILVRLGFKLSMKLRLFNYQNIPMTIE
jgi:hypothetical protein